jgi:hypothetical protein
MVFCPRFPWDPAPEPAPSLPVAEASLRPRGRPRIDRTAAAPADWRYHHLTITGPAEETAAFAGQARGAGVIPWRLDFARIEEDVFNLAVTQPAASRRLPVAGCRILARQFRQRVEAHHAKAVGQIGVGRACPFDLHALLPVPPEILALGPTDPAALAWLAEHWGTTDRLRQVHEQIRPRPGRRLPADHAAVGYGFFTHGDTPDAATARLGTLWPALRFALRPRSLD